LDEYRRKYENIQNMDEKKNNESVDELMLECVLITGIFFFVIIAVLIILIFNFM
jgi:heme/copper-type cytochrome/quinol oxidase subunit 2